MDFNYADYTAQLENSTRFADCDKVPIPDCAKHQNYIFISYSHHDYKKVYLDLAYMYISGVRFWYDAELTAGKDWNAEVCQRINDPHCSGVIFYTSENSFQSESIYQEILTTLGKNKILSDSGLAKNYFCVNLASKRPSRLIDENFIPGSGARLGFDDDRALKSLMKDAFRDSMTYIPFAVKGHEDKLFVQIRRNFNVIDLTGDDASLTGEYNGEMLHGKRTGYGICKYENGIVYEGEWKENKYHGKGKLTYPEGDYRDYLEGIFYEGRANGHCTFALRNGDCYVGNMTDGKTTGHFTYTQNDGFTYVGDMVAGQKEGKGKLVYPQDHSHEFYEGDWKANNPHNFGLMKFKDGSYYEGEWESGQYSGQGKYTYAPNRQEDYYEGQWNNSKRNGQGVLVYKNGDRWEGAWKNGEELTGFGTYRLYKAKQVYYGALENGLFHGQGKLTYAPESHVAFYEGAFVNGKKTGFGTMVFKAQDRYEGNWQDDQYNGFGKFTYKPEYETDYYEGQWLNSEKHGRGILVYKNGDRWEGEWVNGKAHTGFGMYKLHKEKQVYYGALENGLLQGQGKLTYPAESYVDFYEGAFVNGKKTGFGTMVFKAQDRYEGNWQDDEYNGFGKFTYKPEYETDYYEGQWNDSKKHGQGILVYKNGDRWEGEWVNGKLNGTATITLPDGVYKGEIKNNKISGHGVFTYNPNPQFRETYDGEWVDGKQTGHGLLTFLDGSYFDGQWRNGLMHGPGTFFAKRFFRKKPLTGYWVNGKYDWSRHKLVKWLYSSYSDQEGEEPDNAQQKTDENAHND